MEPFLVLKPGSFAVMVGGSQFWSLTEKTLSVATNVGSRLGYRQQQ